jgi:sortase, srtB family
MKTKLAKALIALLVVVAIICGIKIYVVIKENRDNENEFCQISELVEDEKENPYEELPEQNPDFVGWIKIDGTRIDYPVMQSEDDPNYYLHHSFEKEYSRFGVPYVDANCVLGESNNLIIYGHHMNDGSMFASLLKYEDAEFRLEHQAIEFDTVSERGKYIVLAAFDYDTNNEEFNYTHYSNMNEAEFEEYMREVKNRSIYDTSVTAEYGDELLTLSTCEYSHKNGRFVLVAKKVAS